jgi:hypothetical protein
MRRLLRLDSSAIVLVVVMATLLWAWWRNPGHDAAGLVQLAPFLVFGAALSYLRLKVGRTPAVTKMVERMRPEAVQKLPPEATPKLEELRALAEKGRRDRRLSAGDDKRALELLREIAAIEREGRKTEPSTPPPLASKSDDDSFKSIWDEEPSIWQDDRAPRG